MKTFKVNIAVEIEDEEMDEGTLESYLKATIEDDNYLKVKEVVAKETYDNNK